MCRGCWILSARLLNKLSVVAVICDGVAGDFQQDCWEYAALTSWPHKRVTQLSLRHKLSFEPHLYFLLQSLMLQSAPTEQPPQHLLSLSEIWILSRMKLRSVWSQSEVHGVLSACVDSAPFSKTCSKRSCTLSDTSEGVQFGSLFFFSLCCVLLSSTSKAFVVSSHPSLCHSSCSPPPLSFRCVPRFPGSILFGFFPRRWLTHVVLSALRMNGCGYSTSPFSLFLSLTLSLLLLWVLLSLRYFWRWMEQVLIQLSAPGSKFSSWGIMRNHKISEIS